jgi:hypothetical protein
MSVTERAKTLFNEDKRKRFGLWVRVDNSILFSLAFSKLCGHAVKVLLWAMTKIPLDTKLDKRRRKITGQKKPDPPPFSFTHSEAELFGLSSKQFARAIRELVEFGFLDVRHKGSGKHKDFSMYAWSERWRKFDREDFERVPFPENLRHLPRGTDGRWISNRSDEKNTLRNPPMSDLRNTGEMCRCDGRGNGDFNGRKVALKAGNNGKNVPLVNSRKVPLKKNGGVVVSGPWAEEEPLVADFGVWVG